MKPIKKSKGEQDMKNYVDLIRKQEIRHYGEDKLCVRLKFNVKKAPEFVLIGLVRKLLGLDKKDKILFEGTPERTKDLQSFLVKVNHGKDLYEISCNRPSYNWVASK